MLTGAANSRARLHALSPDELEAHAAVRRWPKWSTMCLLRRCGLKVLDACHVAPNDEPEVLDYAVNSLADALNADRLMLRSDGGVETTTYYRGGNTFPLPEIRSRARGLLNERRAVILLEPTNRFTNRTAALIRMDRSPGGVADGTFTIEALGPGYDVSDLTRGGIAPQITITVDGIDWNHHATPWWHDFRITRSLDPDAEKMRRRQRLSRLAHHILRDIGQLGDEDDIILAAENWLRDHEYTHLFSGTDPTAQIVRRAKEWFDDAALLASVQPNRSWQCLATAVSDLGGRTVFWDLVDGSSKYGTSADASSRYTQ